jgi:hypothetical protein
MVTSVIATFRPGSSVLVQKDVESVGIAWLEVGMAQAPRQLTPERDIRCFFGAELRRYRELGGLSQVALGKAVYHSGDFIAKIEKATRWPPLGLVESCDEVLRTGGALSRMWPLLENQRAHLADMSAEHRSGGGQTPGDQGGSEGDSLDRYADSGAADTGAVEGRPQILRFRIDDEGQVRVIIGRRTLLLGVAATAMGRSSASGITGHSPFGSLDRQGGDLSEFDAVMRATWPGAQVSSSTTTLGRASWALELPGGASFAGASTGIHVEPYAREPGRPIQLPYVLPHEPRNGAIPRLVIAACKSNESLSYFAVAPRPGTNRDPQPLNVPAAYELDDLTYAVLWAVSNLDQALLSDDAALAEAHQLTRTGEWAGRQEVARDEVAGLAAVSQMWLGSDFCARHITGHLDQLGEVPVFWTREQRGEDASTWLLFAHKLNYLRTTTALYSGSSVRPMRIFCVPESAVTGSPRTERILLLLSAALMEAHGVTVHVSTEPGHSDVPGFVLAPSSSTSLIATWIRAEKIWHVDETSRRPVGREFMAVAGDATACSINAAPAPFQRLERLAYYLGLDWRWLRRRAGEVSAAGWAGLARPQSRLLSVTGLDEACRYLAAPN